MNATIETGVTAICRSSSDTETSYNLDPTIFPDGSLMPGDLVEISGDSNSGKSLLLLELIARIVLPKNCGGLELGAVLIDCENSYMRANVLSIMEKHILNQGDPTVLEGTILDPRQMDAIQQAALERLHLISCYSLEQFEFSLLALPALFSEHCNIAFLLIDSIATFYWTKCTVKKLVRQDTYQRTHCKTLRSIAQRWRRVVFYTKPAHFGSSGLWQDFEMPGLLTGATQEPSSSSGNQQAAPVLGGLSASASTTSISSTIDHRIELSEMDNPSPRSSGSDCTPEQRFHAFITAADNKQFVRFYLIDKYGFSWIDQ